MYFLGSYALYIEHFNYSAVFVPGIRSNFSSHRYRASQSPFSDAVSNALNVENFSRGVSLSAMGSFSRLNAAIEYVFDLKVFSHECPSVWKEEKNYQQWHSCP
jgi:hypothetical protein